MFRKVLMLMAIVLVLLAFEVRADVIDSNWVGDYGIWGDANNWEPPEVPDNNELDTYVVKIEGYSNGPDIGLLQSRTVNQLDCYGTETIYLASWKGLLIGTPVSVKLTLEDPNGLTNHGELALGALDVHGNITNYWHLEIEEVELIGNATNYGYLELAEVELEGDVTNHNGAKLEFETPGSEINGNLYNLTNAIVTTESWAEIKQGNIENAGLVVIYSNGQMMFENQFRNSGKIQVNGGSLSYWDEENGPGVLDNNSPGLITGFGVVDANQLLLNKGTICASSGSLLLYTNSSITNTGTLKNDVGATLHIQTSVADVNNQGIIQINAAGATVFDCNLVNEPNGIIELLGGTLAATTIMQAADANFAGFGGITGDVSIDPNGIIKLTGPTNIVGDVNIPTNATLEISDGTTLITGHTICNNGNIHMIGGRLIPQGGFTNSNCNITWEEGAYSSVADLNLDGKVDYKDFAYLANAWLSQASWL